MPQKPSNAPMQIDDLDSRVMKAPVSTPDQGAAKKIAVDDPDLLDLQIKRMVINASEPTEEIANRLACIKSARNPLLEAAQPLLLALAQLPRQVFRRPEQVTVFRKALENEVITFSQLCDEANIKREHSVAASYALCSALDEFANHTSWGGGKGKETGIWFTQMLASQFHGDTQGGKKVFLLVGRLMGNPAPHLHLLEVMFRILSLGVEGQYSNQPNGRRDVDIIRACIYAEISKARESVPLPLSPNWKGEAEGKLGLLRSIPVWVTASVLTLAAFGLFSWYKYQLLTQINVLEEQIAAIGKMTPPPAPIVPRLRLTELLRDEIASGQVKVDEDAKHSAVIFKGDDMFVPGQAKVSLGIMPLLDKVADQIAKVSGSVQVIGHTDNVPIKTAKFPNNQMLSEERAASVADALQIRGVSASRLDISGKGDSEPVAGNKTPAQRARNRRVEIIVRQSDGSVVKTSIAGPDGTASMTSNAVYTPASVAR
ncbi:type VI secretion system protein TssL, long form [Collimonas antrihumi]|uniref:type VI secretion system protein TssL, long form n=1 Tax=Collimonas antrihumi TaxID=1940615 RepID=UPI001B8D946F|nr:type VI secretion system protein TssL, long form [Collimonas antrihumi]